MVKIPKNIDPVRAGKMALVVIIIVLTVVIAWRIIRWLKLKNYGSDTIQPPSPGTLSFGLDQFEVFADTIEQAVSRSDDDEDAIYGVFGAMLKVEDVKQLIITYGERKYVQPLGFWKETGNLVQTIHAKLSQNEIDKINETLTSKNINFKI